MLLGCGIILWWSFYPYKPFSDQEPALVKTPIVQSGGNLVLIKKYCKRTYKTAKLVRTLEDGVVIQLPTVESTLPEGCYTKEVVVPIPETIPAGTYFLKTISEYKMNPIREVDVPSQTVQFTIIK